MRINWKQTRYNLLICVSLSCYLSGTLAQSQDTDFIVRDFSIPIPLFSAGSAWRQSAASAAVLSNSDEVIKTTYRVLRGDVSDQYPPGAFSAFNWPFLVLTFDEWSVSVFRSGIETESVVLCSYDGIRSWPNEKFPASSALGGPIDIPKPVGVIRPPGPSDLSADGHTVLFNPDTSVEYDLWQPSTQRGGECQSLGGGLKGSTILEAGFADLFSTTGTGVNEKGVFSARASGIPLLAGLLLPEDIENGVIEHALGFAIPGPRNLSQNPEILEASEYIYPASVTESEFFSLNPNAMVMGQRIRLKQSIRDEEGNLIDEANYSPVTRMLLTALREYGAYLVDNAGGFTFAVEDIHSGFLNVTDDQVNALIGADEGASLAAGKTRWQIVVEKMATELDLIPIPIASGLLLDGQDPATAEVEFYNFELIDSDNVTEITDADWDGDSIDNLMDADDDNDGITDVFENTHGLDPLDESDAALDADSDGATNLQEFLTDTDPNDAASIDACFDANTVAVDASSSSLAIENRLYFGNPGSNANQQTFLRFVNESNLTTTIEVYGIDDAGNASRKLPLGFTLAPLAAKQINAQDIENGYTAKGLTSNLCDGEGKWQFLIRSDNPVKIVGLIRTSDGFLTSLGNTVPRSGSDNLVYFMNPASNSTQQSFLRIINSDAEQGVVTITGIDDAGISSQNSISFALDGFESKQITAQDLEDGNASKGLTGSLDDGNGKWRLTVTSALSLEVMSLIRTSDGFLTNLSEVIEPGISDELLVYFVNPASETTRTTFLRVINIGEQEGTVTISGIDDDGNVAPNGDVIFELGAG